MKAEAMGHVDRVLNGLQGAGCAPERTGMGYHIARCPVHQGPEKSLVIQQFAARGPVFVYCSGGDGQGEPGCTTEAIVAALGLRLEDLNIQAQEDFAQETGARGPARRFADAVGGEVPIHQPRWPKPPAEVAFGGLAGAVVRLIEPATEADPAALLLQLLVGFGNAIGRGLHVLADAHRHHANEYVVTVGETSRARKGTAWRQVRPFLSRIDPAWAEHKITSGLSSGEGLIWEVRDPSTDSAPPTGGPAYGDSGVADKRLLIVEGEFGRVLRVLAREGNTLSGVLRLGWDGDDLRTMTKQSPVKATRTHVSLAGHITQHELAKYLSDVEVFGGLGNRILWAAVKRSKILPRPQPIDEAPLARLGSRLAAAAQLARTAGETAWTSTGLTLWESNYGRLTEDRPGLWGAITARAEAHVLRLALLYAALDRSAEIADTHLHSALALWHYCDQSAALLFGAAVGDRAADAILEALRQNPQGMTRTEIRRGVTPHNVSAGALARALGLLLRFQLVRQEISTTAGRPAERWFAAQALP